MSTSERLLKIRWKIGVIFRLNFNPSCRGLFLGCSSSQRIALLSKKVHFLHHRAQMEDVVWRGGRNFTGSLEKMTSSKKKTRPMRPLGSTTLCCSKNTARVNKRNVTIAGWLLRPASFCPAILPAPAGEWWKAENAARTRNRWRKKMKMKMINEKHPDCAMYRTSPYVIDISWDISRHSILWLGLIPTHWYACTWEHLISWISSHCHIDDEKSGYSNSNHLISTKPFVKTGINYQI